jgi:parallel beta-helix repeat protein
MREDNWAHSAKLVTCAIAGLLGVACGDDESTSGGTGGAGGTTNLPGCSVTLAPGTNDTESLQTALIRAKSDSTLCLTPGTYRVEKELEMLGINGVTVKGTGATRDEVVLDFAGQQSGDDAMAIKADRFTLENVTVKDAPGDGVKITASDRPTFRNVKAYWSAGSVSTNGAYALYPAECSNVLIEDCEVVGSSDAGIYLGQSSTGIVRNNKAHGCVIGIEAENSLDVEIYGNEAWDNSCGILVTNLPGLVKKEMLRGSVHDNVVRENDHENFGDPGAVVGAVPPGTGILVLASDNVEIHKNSVRSNGGAGILILSWPTVSVLGGFQANDPAYDLYTETVNIHDNTFEGNGNAPPSVFTDGMPLNLSLPVEAILWDGFVDAGKDAATADARRLCIKNNTGATFRNINAPELGQNQKTDLTPHDCSFPALAAVKLP